MYGYIQLLGMLGPVDEASLILDQVKNEDKFFVLKQYDSTMLNAKNDGSDMAQVYLKSIISKYPTWGEPALIYGICLAMNGELTRAEQSIEYAISNHISTETNFAVAQEVLKTVREDLKNPENSRHKQEIEVGKTLASLKAKGLISDEDSVSARKGMQAPILVRASRGNSKAAFATDKERREVMLRAQSTNGELPSDNISVESVRTPAEKARIAVGIVAAIVVLALVGVLIYFVVLPAIGKLNSVDDTNDRLNFLVDILGENNSDPTVASILEEYASEYDAEGAIDRSSTPSSGDSIATDTSIETPVTAASSAQNADGTSVETATGTTVETSVDATATTAATTSVETTVGA